MPSDYRRVTVVPRLGNVRCVTSALALRSAFPIHRIAGSAGTACASDGAVVLCRGYWRRSVVAMRVGRFHRCRRRKFATTVTISAPYTWTAPTGPLPSVHVHELRRQLGREDVWPVYSRPCREASDLRFSG